MRTRPGVVKGTETNEPAMSMKAREICIVQLTPSTIHPSHVGCYLT